MYSRRQVADRDIRAHIGELRDAVSNMHSGLQSQREGES